MIEKIFTIIAAWTGAMVVTLSSLFFGPADLSAPVAVAPSATETVAMTSPAAPRPIEPSPQSIPEKHKLTPPPATVLKPPAPAPTVARVTPPLPVPVSPPPAALPGPLFKRAESPPPAVRGEDLDPATIFILGNTERTKEGLPPLTYNTRLAAIAEAKARDMIQKQYFAHESPEGIDVSGLAERFGYVYRAVGENLAMGDLQSSAHVIDGWMNSPGHRANILGKQYTEIGVAAIRGFWAEEGREVWYAVQEFGTPLPDCKIPDELIGQKITAFAKEIEELAKTLEKMQVEVDAAASGPRDIYAAKVEDYNRAVAGYNDIVALEKSLIVTHNEEVRVYNSCIDG